MIIDMTKFGTVLTSRQAGREAYGAFLPTLNSLDKSEAIVVDFAGISALAPSWGDEFLTLLQEKFGERLTLKNTSNPSVSLTIEMLEQLNGAKFTIN